MNELAYEHKKSLGELLDMYFGNRNYFLTPTERKEKIDKFLGVRKKLLKAGSKDVNLVRALREDRERDNA